MRTFRSIIVGLLIIAGVIYKYIIYMFTPFSAGTHGSIKSYSFNVSKYRLEEIIAEEIANNRNIQLDTSKENNYYNSGGYLTVLIKGGGTTNKYTFRYYGGEEYWDTQPENSSIFISYLYDDKGMVISEGAENVEKNEALVNERLKIFETEFIDLIQHRIGEKEN
ncbi:MAG: hypothetical protein NVV82_13175 [Sporocytophaga sp.]|nr:hypothetical protein [Sporocytophaga sp.]